MSRFIVYVVCTIFFQSFVEASFAHSSQKLTASYREGYDRFGEYFALDGNVLISGIPTRDLYLNSRYFTAGIAYIFERDTSGNWTEFSEIVSPNPGSEERFGQVIEVDGNTAMIAQGTSVFA